MHSVDHLIVGCIILTVIGVVAVVMQMLHNIDTDRKISDCRQHLVALEKTMFSARTCHDNYLKEVKAIHDAQSAYNVLNEY